jgi:DNA-binding transcriptional regulator YhcF (GntR family)
MDIRISKQSDVPVRQQLAEQIVLLIATEKLKPGEAMPSVRELARRLKIHHNTVSHAYAELVQRTWLERKRGSNLTVRAPLPGPIGARARAGRAKTQDLEDLLNQTIAAARQMGFSLQQLRDQIRQRMIAEPPDHLLVVEQEPGLRWLLQEELQEALGLGADGCSREELAANAGLAIGALLVTPQYALSDVEPLGPRDRPAVPLVFCGADEHVERIRKLKEPSVIAIVSVSEAFRSTAQSLIAQATRRLHTLMEISWPLDSPGSLRGADVIFCDSIAYRELKSPKCFRYRLVSPASIEDVAGTLKGLRRREVSGSKPARPPADESRRKA